MADQDFGAQAISRNEDNNAANNGVWVHLADSAGNVVNVTGNALDVNIASGGATEYTEDVVAADPATGNAPLAERVDTPAAITPAAGDWTKLYANANGSLWVAIDGSVVVTANNLDIRDLTHVSDSVKVGDGTDFLEVNGDGSINVNIVQGLLADEFHTADIGNPGANATDTQTVTATGGTMIVTSITVAGSGGVKFVAKNNGVEVMTGFLKGRDGDTKQIMFVPPVEVADTEAFTVERTNRQNTAVDVYSTVMGRQL